MHHILRDGLQKYGFNEPACKSVRIINKAEEEMEMAVVKKGELPSVIHNNECSVTKRDPQ